MMTKDRLAEIARAVEDPSRVEFSIRLKMAEELRALLTDLEIERAADRMEAAHRAAGFYNYDRNNRSPAEG